MTATLTKSPARLAGLIAGGLLGAVVALGAAPSAEAGDYRYRDHNRGSSVTFSFNTGGQSWNNRGYNSYRGHDRGYQSGYWCPDTRRWVSYQAPRGHAWGWRDQRPRHTGYWNHQPHYATSCRTIWVEQRDHYGHPRWVQRRVCR